MATHPNEFHLLWFDPGAAATGWAHLIIHARAFARPERKIMPNLEFWDCGEFTGEDHTQYRAAVDMAYAAHFLPEPFVARTVVGSEDFDLVQTLGSKHNLLSPVRFNAVLAWEVAQHGLQLELQSRSQRVQVTAQRLVAYGFAGPWRKSGKGKDAFAAMQHAVLRLRRIKHESRSRPWKMSDGASSNAWWDCDCEDGKPCDITHSR